MSYLFLELAQFSFVRSKLRKKQNLKQIMIGCGKKGNRKGQKKFCRKCSVFVASVFMTSVA